jgi:hypothetical protein
MINKQSRYRAPPGANKRAASRPEQNGFSNDQY